MKTPIQQLNPVQYNDQLMSAEVIPNSWQPSPKQIDLSNTNIYRDIESLPNIPVLINLKVQD